MTVQIEDFETQNNVDKAVMHLNTTLHTTKLATLTDLVPTPSGTKSQEISKYLFEQPSYNKEWFNILFDSKSMARKEKLKREYLEKVEKGEIFTEETLHAKVHSWSVYNNPEPLLNEFKTQYAGKTRLELVTETLIARGERTWSELTWNVYYNCMRYWPRVPQAVWTVSRGRFLHVVPRERFTGKRLWRKWLSDFTLAYAIKYRFKYFLETESRRFVQQAVQFLDYRSAIATIALGSYVFGMMNYLHHYSRSEQVRKRMFEGSRVFTPVLISKESQENYATLIEEGIQKVHDSIQVNSTPTYGAYGETLGRKIQYESEVQEDGATKKLIYYKKHDVVRTSIPTDDLIHLKPVHRSKEKRFTETGGVPRELLTNEVQESQTDTPEFQVYGDNRFYVERTFDTNLRLDQPFAPREDDCQEFEETLQPEPEVPMEPGEFNHTYSEAHNLQVERHNKTLEEIYLEQKGLKEETKKKSIDEIIQKLTEKFDNPTFVEDLESSQVVDNETNGVVNELGSDNGETWDETDIDDDNGIEDDTDDENVDDTASRTFLAELDDELMDEDAYIDRGRRNYCALIPKPWSVATTKSAKTKQTSIANADKSWAKGGKTKPVAIEAKTAMPGLNTGLMNVSGWTLPTTELSYPFLSVKEVAKAVDPDLGQYKANFEDIEKGADESARWYSRYEVEDEANEYIDEILGIQDENDDTIAIEDNGTDDNLENDTVHSEKATELENKSSNLTEFANTTETLGGETLSVDPVDSIEFIEGETLYELNNDTEIPVEELDMGEFNEHDNTAILENSGFEELVEEEESEITNYQDNDDKENELPDGEIEPGFASRYPKAKLNRLNVASDPHFGDELTGLSHTEAKLFHTPTGAKHNLETRMFLHGTDEKHSLSLGSTSFDLEDNIANVVSKRHVRLIRFWQSNALVVYPVIAVYLVRRSIRYQKQRIGRGRRHSKNSETHKYYTHLGRSPQRAQLCDLTGNEGETRQIRELLSAFTRVRGFTETYRPGILINLWEIDILPRIPRRVRTAFLPPNGEMYLWYQKQRKKLFGEKNQLQREFHGQIPVETFWNSPAINELYGCERDDTPFETSLEIFETVDNLMTTVESGPKNQRGVNQKIGQYLYTNSQKNTLATIEKIQRYFPEVMAMVLKAQEIWDHTPLLAAIRPGKYSLESLPRGLLLIGESGNGRTLMARAIASESGLPIMLTEGMRFVHQRWGCFRLRSLFYRARLHYPCILYIKNLELITLHRSIFTGYFNVRNCAQFLVCFDGLVDRKKSTVRQPFIIGSVETSKYMDPACVRSGRFEWAIKFGLPNAQQRYNLLTTALEKNGQPMEKDVSLPFFALTTFGYSAQEVEHMIGISGFLSVTKYERERNYTHSNASLAEAVGSSNRLIMRHEDEYLHSTDIFEDGFNARLTAYEEKGDFPHRLSTTIKNDGFIPFETKWIHMFLELYGYGKYPAKEGWPIPRSFSNARSPEEFEARNRASNRLVYDLMAPQKGLMPASDPEYINFVLSVQMTENNPLPFTKETVYHASADALVTWGVFDLLSEFAFFSQMNRKLQGTQNFVIDSQTCYDTYAHEFAEQLGDRLSPYGHHTHLERIDSGLEQHKPESRLMTHFRRVVQKDKTTVGIGKSWVSTTRSGLSRIVDSRGALKHKREKETRLSLRNWSYRQELALDRRTTYWRERKKMRLYSIEYNLKNVTDTDHNQNSRVTRLYFRDALIESRQKRQLRVSLEPSTYDTFATRKLVVRARKPVAEPSELLAGDIISVWFDWAKTA